jgi:hypothetical protein
MSLASRTRNKVKILGGDYKDALLEVSSRAALLVP